MVFFFLSNQSFAPPFSNLQHDRGRVGNKQVFPLAERDGTYFPEGLFLTFPINRSQEGIKY